MNEARLLDTADRFVNCKCVKYYLRSNSIDLAIETAGLFTRVSQSVLYCLSRNNYFSCQSTPLNYSSVGRTLAKTLMYYLTFCLVLNAGLSCVAKRHLTTGVSLVCCAQEGLPPLQTMDEMQCMWFQMELAWAYHRMGKLGEALQKLHEIDHVMMTHPLPPLSSLLPLPSLSSPPLPSPISPPPSLL